MADSRQDNEDLLIIDDGESESGCTLEPWQVLVVDDDEEVHAATRLALARTTILGKPLALTHALSACEAKLILEKKRDFAAILLDVVMETEIAGLQLVSEIRKTFGMEECRIILRTGQPGSAPEIAVFNDYDINDYCTKSELTRTRLITALMAALHSYQQIRTIAENRRGLELIVRAVPSLMESHAINAFAEGVLTQIAALLKIPAEVLSAPRKALRWIAEKKAACLLLRPPAAWRTVLPNRWIKSAPPRSLMPLRTPWPITTMFSMNALPCCS